MADTREKLIELLKEADRYEFEEQKKKGDFSVEAGWKLIADNLIANGVTIQPLTDCKQPVTDNNVGCKLKATEPLTNCQRWIPVTERLPEYFGTFIVVITDTDGVHTDAADFDPFEKKWLTYACYSKYYKVTHWMPLPQPPKGE